MSHFLRRTVGVLLILLAGLAIGAGAATLRLWAVPWQGYVTGGPDDPRIAARGRVTSGAPRVEVDRTEYDFGPMDMDLEGRHAFVFTNTGGSVLRLSKGATSCGCTLSQLDETEIPAGRSAKVVVVWKAKKEPGEYKESATIMTNDPSRDRVVLTVTGRMVPAVELVPAAVSLGQLSVSQPASGEVRVYGFRPQPLEILDHELSDPATAGQFTVQVEPLPEGEIRERPDARSGFLIGIKVKSGLPLGAIRQTIRLKTNYRDRPPVEIPIEGLVTSDLAVFADGWNRETNVLHLGTVTGRRGVRQNVVILARGQLARQVDFKLVEVRPELLHVSLGQTIHTKDRPVAQTTLTIEIPPNTPAANFIGTAEAPMGEIVIATNHPEVPELKINVSFLVEW